MEGPWITPDQEYQTINLNLSAALVSSWRYDNDWDELYAGNTESTFPSGFAATPQVTNISEMVVRHLRMVGAWTYPAVPPTTLPPDTTGYELENPAGTPVGDSVLVTMDVETHTNYDPVGQDWVVLKLPLVDRTATWYTPTTLSGYTVARTFPGAIYGEGSPDPNIGRLRTEKTWIETAQSDDKLSLIGVMEGTITAFEEAEGHSTGLQTIYELTSRRLYQPPRYRFIYAGNSQTRPLRQRERKW